MAKAATETATARMVNEFNAPPWLGGRGREEQELHIRADTRWWGAEEAGVVGAAHL